MKQYDFDRVIDRRNTNAIACEEQQADFGCSGMLPLWIADMGFATPDFIINALKKRLEHPIFGYTALPKDYWETVSGWIEARHGWKPQKEWMSYVPGIVKGIGFAVNVFVKHDEKVIIFPPVYHPFRLTPEANHREVVCSPLACSGDGIYSIDFENLEKVCDSKCRLLIMSNPHNPVGILWDEETLKKLAHFAVTHHLIVISDEIHCDMALWGKKHHPFAAVSEEAAQCSITFGAPSKTFNIAGIVSSYAIVPNPDIRKPFYEWMAANELDFPPIFSPIATIAAFCQGEEWREQMLRYVEQNILLVEDFMKRNIPQIKVVRPDASFLVWLNCKGLGLSHGRLCELFFRKAGVAMNDGDMFGCEGDGFMRLNVGYPRSVVRQALQQMLDAVSSQEQ